MVARVMARAITLYMLRILLLELLMLLKLLMLLLLKLLDDLKKSMQKRCGFIELEEKLSIEDNLGE